MEYANAAPYADQRVLVVGAGNSGAEIATDLGDHGAASVAISVRTPPPIVPRDPFGMPVQRTSILLSALPAAIANRLGRATARIVIGDLTRYGMPAGTFAPYSTRRVPLIDVGFVAALKRGQLTVRPAVERLTATGVVFAGGAGESFDAIIAATGFTTGLESLLDAPGVLDGTANRSADPATRPRIPVCTSTVSRTACAGISSRRTSRRVGSPGTSSAIYWKARRDGRPPGPRPR